MIKLLHFLKPYRVLLIVVLLLALAQVMANLYLPTLTADIVTNGIAQKDTEYIWRTGGVMILVAIGGMICTIVGTLFSSLIAIGFGKSIRFHMFSHVEQFSLHEFDMLSTASLITRTTNDTTQVQQVLIMILNMVIMAPMTYIGSLILGIRQDAELAWILIVILPFVVAVIILLTIKAVPLFRAMQGKLDKINLILNENLTGIRVIRAFDRVKQEEERFNDANLDLTDVSIRVNRLLALTVPATMLIINISTVSIIWFGSIRVSNLSAASGAAEVGSLIAFLQYAILIMISLLMVSTMFVMLPRAAASATRINEVLAMKPHVKDAELVGQMQTGWDPQRPIHWNRQGLLPSPLSRVSNLGEEIDPRRDRGFPRPSGPFPHEKPLSAPAIAGKKRGYVEFQDVTFSYPGAEEPALANISFSARPGEVTAIIGGTGAGKTSLVSLIPRFYDVDSGRILFDGIDVSEMPQAYLRAKIGFVPQNIVLFSGTIRDNICFGKENATEEEIRHVAEVAQATEFISKMPDGFHSVISQGGTNISGGQKQRLSIARALVRKPEIYVFDDTFSALDFKTDASLRAALRKETFNATVLIVAQRVSTVMDADRIIVLEDGRIVGIGTHWELMKSCKVYDEIVSSQLSVEETV